MERNREGKLKPVEILFSEPRAPRQLGLNESSNNIFRQDLPKSTYLSIHS